MLEHHRRMFHYTKWADSLTIAKLGEWQPPLTPGLRWMAHIISAQQIWLSRIVPSAKPPEAVWPEYSPAQCAEQSAGVLAAWQRFLDGLTEEDMPRNRAYKNLAGDPFETPLTEILAHVVNHSTYHRGQIMSAARAAGFAPPPTDFIVFTRVG